MAIITEQKLIDYLQDMRRQERKLVDEGDWCQKHNYSVEAMLLFEKAEILRKLGNKLLNDFDLDWVNYPKD
jgi:hypothetical protein